jgi:hypothetical protein
VSSLLRLGLLAALVEIAFEAADARAIEGGELIVSTSGEETLRFGTA